MALGGGIVALALQHVRPIHARGFDLDEHLTRARHRHGALLRHKNLGAALAVDGDDGHRSRKRGHARVSWGVNWAIPARARAK